MSRDICHTYQDPLDHIWLSTARALGLKVERSSAAYASTDGHGGLIVSEQASMDPDDCLAQMIFHEICHWLVQGNASIGWVDWGLDNEGSRDVAREHACLRLQAAMLAPFGLRRVLAPTTDFRAFYDALPNDPFSEEELEQRESIVLARAAFARRRSLPFRGKLEPALEATAQVIALTQDFAPAPDQSHQLLACVDPPLPRHPVGLPIYPDTNSTCADCAWMTTSGKKKAVARCRQADGQRTTPESPACAHFESPFDCLACGACCREAYDTVEVKRNDPARKLHPELMVERWGGHDVARSDERCICLRGGIQLTPPRPTISGGRSPEDVGSKLAPRSMPGGTPYTCAIYETRPRTCREFSIFSQHCLDARRRVGLSR